MYEMAISLRTPRAELQLNQPQSLQARMTIPADDDVVVHRNPERLRHVDDLQRHGDVSLRRRRVA
jgi:hypothetical protein